MSKNIKYTVAVVLKKSQDSDDFLVVRRPADDKDLADTWGLPAVTLLPNELPEDGARRACQEKLGCNAKPVRFLGLMFQKRNSYDIFLMDIEMVLEEGEIADTAKSHTTHTAYAGYKWSSNPEDMIEAAKGGSCCASIFLTDRGLLNRDEWIASLEGSDKVS